MLFFRVFAKLQLRRSPNSFLGLTPIPCPLPVLSEADRPVPTSSARFRPCRKGSPNSHRIMSFADPHPLTTIESYLYKSVHGRGYLQLSNLASFKIPSRIHPSFQSLAQCPSCNPFVFMVFHFHGGGGGSQNFKNRIIHSLSLIPNTLSSFFSYACTLSCTQQKLNPFIFKYFRTLCKKLPGGGAAVPRALRASRRGRGASR